MKKQNRSFVIIISIVTYAILHSGEALQCYTCNSIEDSNCKKGPYSDMEVVECDSLTTPTPTTDTTTSTPTHTTTPTPTTETTTPASTTETTTPAPTTETTTPAPTTETTTPAPTTETTTPAPTTETTTPAPTIETTTPAPTTETTTPAPTTETTTPAQTSLSETESLNSGVFDESMSLQNTLNEKLKNNAKVPDHYRLRRSIFDLQRDAYKEEKWSCAIIEHRYSNDTVVVKRGCVPFSYKCPDDDSEEGKCKIKLKCNSDYCNSANTISINMVTLSWLVLSWATVFILTDSCQFLSFT